MRRAEGAGQLKLARDCGPRGHTITINGGAWRARTVSILRDPQAAVSILGRATGVPSLLAAAAQWPRCLEGTLKPAATCKLAHLSRHI